MGRQAGSHDLTLLLGDLGRLSGLFLNFIFFWPCQHQIPPATEAIAIMTGCPRPLILPLFLSARALLFSFLARRPVNGTAMMLRFSAPWRFRPSLPARLAVVGTRLYPYIREGMERPVIACSSPAALVTQLQQ